MRPHKHAELIKAWADGAEIEFRYKIYAEQKRWSNWEGMPSSIYCWSADPDFEYRIKPEPKPCPVHYFEVNQHGQGGRVNLNHLSDANLKLTFDGETGELKSAEVLK